MEFLAQTASLLDPIEIRQIAFKAATVAGAILAACGAVIAFFLKRYWDYRDRQIEISDKKELEITAREKERREEIKELFTSTFTLLENAIRQVRLKEDFSLAQAFSENNAKIHLLAPEHIVEQYSEVTALLESWLRLYFKATPRLMKVGDQTFTIIQAPDPTIEYKEPANAEYKKLQEELRKLVDLMRIELNGST
jgi:hypothetical protein